MERLNHAAPAEESSVPRISLQAHIRPRIHQQVRNIPHTEGHHEISVIAGAAGFRPGDKGHHHHDYHHDLRMKEVPVEAGGGGFEQVRRCAADGAHPEIPEEVGMKKMPVIAGTAAPTITWVRVFMARLGG